MIDFTKLIERITESPRTTLFGLGVGALVFAGTTAQPPVQTYLLIAGAVSGITLGLIAKDPPK